MHVCMYVCVCVCVCVSLESFNHGSYVVRIDECRYVYDMCIYYV